jgi:protein ImuB
VTTVSSGRRILALWFPRLPTDRLQRRKEQPSSPEPLVVVAKIDNALRLTAVDRKATSLGLSAGMPLANARAMLPALKVMTENEPADLAFLERIADWCDRFTPLVALDPPRGLLLDVTGAAHLFAGEPAMLDRIRAGITRQGVIVRGALAGTAAAARALARYRDGTIVSSGEEAEAVAPLPVEALRLNDVATHALCRAGLKTIGQAAARSRTELTARFGAGMIFALEAVLGRAERPITPRILLPDYVAEHRFAEPIVTDDAILKTLYSLSGVLAGMLAERGEGARQLQAVFFRTDGAERRITVETGSPTREPTIIKRLFSEKIDALADPLDPGFGFDLVRLSASRVERAETQETDFNADENAKREIAFLVDRLAARFGSHNILSFQPNDTHIPEAAWTAVPAQHGQNSKYEWERIRGTREAPRRPLRMLAKPEPVSILRAVPDNAPLRFRWRRAVHVVRGIEGPERIAMEWWRHQTSPPTRDYFRVEDEEGRRFWLYRNRADPQWFMQGVFA